MINITDVYKSYGKKNVVLKGTNFSVNAGEIKAIIGVNGSGKSTLIELICGVKKFDSGCIVVDGLDITRKKNRKVLKYTIGYMPQQFNLYLDLTVVENLKYLCAIYKISPSRVQEVLQLCNLQEKAKVLAKNLSGGYRQLLGFAGAILHNPKLLILDEPTSAMDPLFRKFFWNIIKKCNKDGMTILLITHHIEELLQCDTFACLSNGKFCYNGKVKDFKKSGFINIESILEKYKVEVADE